LKGLSQGVTRSGGTSVYIGNTQSSTGPQDIDCEADYYNGWDDSYTIYHTISIGAPPTIPTTFPFSNLSHTYDGSTKTASVTSSPGGADYSSDLTKGPDVAPTRSVRVQITLIPARTRPRYISMRRR